MTRFTELIQFGKIQNVGGLELSAEKNLMFHWRKISNFALTKNKYIYIYRLKKKDIDNYFLSQKFLLFVLSLQFTE